MYISAKWHQWTDSGCIWRVPFPMSLLETSDTIRSGKRYGFSHSLISKLLWRSSCQRGRELCGVQWPAKPAVVEQHSEGCDSEEVPDIPPTSSAKRKKSLVEEKREHVQGIFEDLRRLHQTKYTASQYMLWVEAINIGRHVRRETPPLGTMFQQCGAPLNSYRNPQRNTCMRWPACSNCQHICHRRRESIVTYPGPSVTSAEERSEVRNLNRLSR